MTGRTRCLAAAMMLAATTPVMAQTPTPAPDERAAVLSVVQRLWDAMRARDTAALRTLFDSGAVLTRVTNRGGSPTVEYTPVGRFIEALGKATAPWNETMYQPEVRIDGPLATVWTEYDFSVGSQFSHCGVDAFVLLKTRDGWKIVTIADTARRDGCPKR